MEQWTTMANNKWMAIICYLVPLAGILVTWRAAGLIEVVTGLGISLLIVVIAALFGPKGSLLRFHAAQSALLCLVGILTMAAGMYAVTTWLVAEARQAGPQAGPALGMFMVLGMIVVFCGGALVFGLLFLYALVRAGQGHDARLPGIGSLAGRIAGYPPKVHG